MAEKKVRSLIKFRGLLSCHGVSGRCILRLHCENLRGMHELQNRALWSLRSLCRLLLHISKFISKINVQFNVLDFSKDTSWCNDGTNIAKIFTIFIERRWDAGNGIQDANVYDDFSLSVIPNQFFLIAFSLSHFRPRNFNEIPKRATRYLDPATFQSALVEISTWP